MHIWRDTLFYVPSTLFPISSNPRFPVYQWMPLNRRWSAVLRNIDHPHQSGQDTICAGKDNIIYVVINYLGGSLPARLIKVRLEDPMDAHAEPVTDLKVEFATPYMPTFEVY
ncbi:virion structural protein [Pseudomonas phage PhiPA3]|uniref:Virion structural protein n=1 Tax=Pseudomonas phage PhiPA3 TaxID=998086 RepID=F8SJJ5_BPPA3|nr:virion structural protein [Pseudomonas phage PhiPA3]AEH03786.1 virion structural protein [Pseudomonas phage PhiPA3]